MKLNKAIFLATTLILQFAGSVVASAGPDMAAYQAAILGFAQAANPSISDIVTAANYVYGYRNTGVWSDNQKIAKALGNTPQALAVGALLSKGAPGMIALKFPGADSYANTMAAINNIISSAAPSAPAPTMSGPTPSAPAVAPSAPVAAPSAPAQGSSNFTTPVSYLNPANYFASAPQSAQQQQSLDAQAASAGSQALMNIAASGQSGAALYMQYVDYMFNLLGQALAAIPDAATQQAVLAEVQKQTQGLSASVKASASYNSRTLGRFSSKAKKAKKSSK